jgi:hypothetical protein
MYQTVVEYQCNTECNNVASKVSQSYDQKTLFSLILFCAKALHLVYG